MYDCRAANHSSGVSKKPMRRPAVAQSILNRNMIFFVLGGFGKALFCAALFRNSSNGVLIVTKSNRDASDPGGRPGVFRRRAIHIPPPSKETLPYRDSGALPRIHGKTHCVLSALLEGRRDLRPPRQVPRRLLSPVEVFGQSIPLRGSSLEVDVERLFRRDSRSLGYQREDRVYYPGSSPVRGDIVDVFSYGSDHPHRLAVFDDHARVGPRLTPSTQRSSGEVRSAVFLPAKEVVLTAPILESLKKGKTATNLAVSRRSEEPGGDFPGLENYLLRMRYESPAILTDYREAVGLDIRLPW